MAQVVNSENLVEFISTGKVAEFKPPEPAKSEGIQVNGTDANKVEDNKVEGNTVTDAKALQPRDTDGKFQSPSGEKSSSENGKAAPQPADGDDPDSVNLTEHAKRVIGKKHRQMKEAEEFARTRDADAAAERARADALQRELNTLKGAKSGQGPAAGEADGSDPDEPKPEDFKTVGEYTRALTKYEVAKTAKAAGEAGRRQNEQDRAKAQAEETTTAFVERQAEFRKTHPDYDEIVGESDLEVPNIAMQYIVESGNPELGYFLAKNPSEAERLRKLSPTRVIAELGKLEARLENEAKSKEAPKGDPTAQQTRQVSRAPAPIQPLNGDSATPVHKDPSQMSFQELRAHRMAERAAGKRV